MFTYSSFFSFFLPSFLPHLVMAMVTSTVARSMASLFSAVLLLLVTLVSGQSVQPSNASLPATESTLTQLTISGGGLLSQTVFNIAPLTPNVGMGGSPPAVAVRIPPRRRVDASCPIED